VKTVRVFLLATLAIALGWGGIGQIASVSASANVARIVEHESFTGQTANLSSAASVTVPSGGADYRISFYPTHISGGSAGLIGLAYTDDAGTQNTELTMNGTILFGNYVAIVHAASGNLTVFTTGTQDAGAQTYNFYVTIEEL
jgi:hypothetical protein